MAHITAISGELAGPGAVSYAIVDLRDYNGFVAVGRNV